MIIKSAELGVVAALPTQLPKTGLPEVAFAGRSNVGKSSLINALLNRKRLAQTSSTPGKTRNIFFYTINSEFYFVDLPGYGYAKLGQEARAFFKVLVDAYFFRPTPPRLCFLLLDPKRPVGVEEMDFLRFMMTKGISPVVVFTRWDRLKTMEKPPVKAQRLAELGGLCRNPLFVSSKTKEGMDLLWKEIVSHLNLGG